MLPRIYQRFFLRVARRKRWSTRRAPVYSLALPLVSAVLLVCWSRLESTSASRSPVVFPGEQISIRGFERNGPQEPVPTLELGKTIMRSLAGGETHVYQATLIAGQYLHITVNQRGIDVVLRLASPDQKGLVEMDSPNIRQGQEAIAVTAEQSGDYRLEIVSTSKNVPSGQYEVTVDALRTPTKEDQEWMAAQTAYAAGRQARSQGTPTAREIALTHFAEAQARWRAAGDIRKEAHALAQRAFLYSQLGQPQKALQHFQQALALHQSHKLQVEEPAVLNAIAVAYTDLGEPLKSLEYYDQALKGWRELNDVYGEALTLSNQGLAYALLGEPKRAIDLYQQALVVWRRLQNRQQEAFTVHNIGGVYEVSGEWQKSLESYQQALGLYKEAGNRAGEARILNNIGITQRKLGEPVKAIENHERSIAISRSTGDRLQLAIALINSSLAYARLNDSQKAFAQLNEALPLLRATGNRLWEGIALQTVGDLQATASDHRQALASYEQALKLQRAVGNRYLEAIALDGIGAAYTALEEPQKAIEQHGQSLKLVLELGDRRGEARARYGLARAHRALGAYDAARQEVEAAIARVEVIRAEVGSQQLRSSFLATVQPYYELLIDLSMQLHVARPAEGFDALALQASERARARSLLDLLAESSADLRQGIDAGLLIREREIRQQLNAKAERLTQNNTPTQRAALQRELSQLETDYETAQAEIRKTSPRYAAITQPQPFDVRVLQAQTLDADTLLLAYALGEERSYLWAVTQTSLTAYQLPPRAEIEAAARRVNHLLTARAQRLGPETALQRSTRIAAADAELPAAAQALSQMTLAPAAAQLGDKRLLIVADGALQYVPFAMLPDPAALSPSASPRRPVAPSPVPLVVRHEIVTLPSASTLAVMRRELAGRAPAPKQLAVFADPVFDDDDERAKTKAARPGGALNKPGGEVVAAAEAGRSIVHEEKPATSESGTASGGLLIQRLPYTRQEADRILAIAPGGANLKATDFRASRALATGAELSQYRYLHFATHGLLDTERPGLSALVLSLVDEHGRAQDGFLRAHDIYNLRLPAELIVLSACQTGLGKEIRGEGLVGLTRGFMYAGAARVIVSLWNVNDRATADLMAKLYQRMLKGGERPAAALRAAQVEMWRQRQWQAPYYWAAFVLQGEWK